MSAAAPRSNTAAEYKDETLTRSGVSYTDPDRSRAGGIVAKNMDIHVSFIGCPRRVEYMGQAFA